jgi:hypothetical protein
MLARACVARPELEAALDALFAEIGEARASGALRSARATLTFADEK